ncbi:hypothetical protein [Ancylobacter sp.]|uniref:hypothetical protein n=1 Tax=Ancylobacter sp. TaxID=1872567 RepID=UPI003C79C5E0
MTFNRVVITGDIFRVDSSGAAGHQSTAIQWLHSLLRYPIKCATGLDAKLLTIDEFRITLAEIYAFNRSAPTVDAWAHLFEEMPKALSDIFISELNDALVIGWELPKSLCDALRIANITYIELSVHPIRFMDDILISARSNSPTIDDALLSQSVTEQDCYIQAGIISAFFIRRTVPRDEPYALFAAQTKVDRSLLKDGKLLSQKWIADELLAHLPQGMPLLLKDHPVQPSDELFRRLRSAGVNVQRMGGSIYRQFSDRKMTSVYTVSSSAGLEAKYFGHTTKFLYKPCFDIVFHGQPHDASRSQFKSIDTRVISPNFWRIILTESIKTTPLAAETISSRPDLLRATLNFHWGFGEIFNDFTVNSSGAITPYSTASRIKTFVKRLLSIYNK